MEMEFGMGEMQEDRSASDDACGLTTVCMQRALSYFVEKFEIV